MNRIVLAFFACLFAMSLSAQTPTWNPDYNGDSVIGVDDLLGLLSAFGFEFTIPPTPIEVGKKTGDLTTIYIPATIKYFISQGGLAPEYHRLSSENVSIGDVKYVTWCVSYTNSSMNGLVHYQAEDSSGQWQNIGYCLRIDNGSITCSDEAVSQGGNTPSTASPRHFKFMFGVNGWSAVENDIESVY